MAQPNTYDSRAPLSLMVLGSPAAGAQQLAGILQHLGCDLPLESQQSSTDGTQPPLETPAISTLNAQVFDTLGRASSDLALPRPHWQDSPIYNSLVREAAALLKVQFTRAHLPLLWTPHLPVLADLWRDALRHCGYEVACLHMHGDPQAGATPEGDEVPLPAEHGQLAWLRDVVGAERATRGHNRLYVSQNGLAQDWRAEISTIEQALGFAFPRNTPKTGRHVDAALQAGPILAQVRHNTAPQQIGWLREVAGILSHWQNHGEDATDHTRLDVISADFEIAAEQIDIFTEALRSDGAAQREKVRKLEADLTEQQRARQAADTSAEGLQAELEKVNEVQERALARLAEAEERSRTHAAEREALEQLVEQDQDALTKLQQALADRDLQIRKLESSLEQRFDELATLNRVLFDTEAERALAQRVQVDEPSNAREAEPETLELQQALADRDVEIRKLENSLEQRFNELATLSRLLFDTEAQTAEKLSQLAREAQEARERERYVQGAIDEVLSSTSWKLTAPVRRTLNFLRGSSRQT